MAALLVPLIEIFFISIVAVVIPRYYSQWLGIFEADCEQFRLYGKTWVSQLASKIGEKNPETTGMLLQQKKKEEE